MGDETTAVALARLEGKIDGVLFRLEQNAKDHDDHEGRIRKLEDQRVVTPRAMWMGIGTIATVAGTVGPYLFTLYGRR